MANSMIVVCMGFEERVKAYLDGFAENDAEFKTKYTNGEKTIGGFYRYFMEQLKKSYIEANGNKEGCTGIADEDVYSMAVTYFEEDAIVEKKPEPAPTATKPKEEQKKNRKKKQVVQQLPKPDERKSKEEPKQSSTTQMVQLSLFD